MKKQKIGLLLIIVAMLLAACAGNGGNSGSGNQTNGTDTAADADGASSDGRKKVTITYWNGYTGPDRPALEAAVKTFNDTHDNVEVKMDIMPWDVMFQKLTAASASGGGPDIVTMGVEELPKYLDMDVIQPIDDLEAIVDPSILPEAFLPYMQNDGKYIAFPMGFFSVCLYYNKDMFQAAGLDPEAPPANWDQLIDYAQKLTVEKDGTVEQYGLALSAKESIPNWPILLWGGGGDVVDVESMKSVINSPQNVETVKKFADLVLNKRISPPAPTGLEVAQLFSAGKAAMMIGGPWEISGMRKAGINVGVAQVPAGPAADVTYGGGTYTIMTKGGVEKKEAVAEYLKYWVSKETQTAWSLGSGYPPVRTDMLDMPEIANESAVKEFAKGLTRAKFYNVGFKGASRLEREAWTPAFEAILLQKKDVQTELDKAAKMIDSILAEEK